jgi:hypothetical protein
MRQVSARQYVELLMSWIEEQLNDENTFPTSTGEALPGHGHAPT